jgi:hypothetical protein
MSNNSGSGKGTSKVISAEEHNATRREAKRKQKLHARKGAKQPQHGNFLKDQMAEKRAEFHKLHSLLAIDILEQDKLHGLARSLVVSALSNFAVNSDLSYKTAFKQALTALQESRVKEDARPLSASLIEFAERKFTNVMNHAYSLAKGQQDEDRVAIESSNGVLAYTSG